MFDIHPCHALVRKPSPRYAAFYAPKGILISDSFAAAQHAIYRAELENSGLSVTALPAHPDHHDCVFIEDTAIVCAGRALITRMNDLREGEQRDVETYLKSRLEIVQLAPEVRLEGGDVLHLDDLTLVGRSARTNDAGIEAMRQFLAPLGRSVQPIPVTRCLHLKSAMTYLGNKTVLISPELIDAELPDGYQRLHVDSSEPHAANALRIRSSLLFPAGFPRTRALLGDFARKHGFDIVELNISEFQKGDGALTCQSIVY